MNKVVFRALVAILALGWMMVMGWIVGPGFDSGALWVVGFFLALTLSLVLISRMPEGPPGNERPRPGPPTWSERLVESKPGMILQVVLFLMLTVGAGSVVGVILCGLVKGVVETITGFPEILGTATIGAAMSMIGFGLFALMLRLLGPILFVVYEAWTAYIAPVIGGTVGAAIGSGCLTVGIPVVALSALVGALALLIFGASTGERRIGIKDVGETLIAGIGFGLVNGAILAVLFAVLKALT